MTASLPVPVCWRYESSPPFLVVLPEPFAPARVAPFAPFLPFSSVLSAAGVVPVQRDADAVRLFPDDAYDLSPGSFAELHPDLRVPGLEWGAAKAYVHRRRHAGGTAG